MILYEPDYQAGIDLATERLDDARGRLKTDLLTMRAGLHGEKQMAYGSASPACKRCQSADISIAHGSQKIRGRSKERPGPVHAPEPSAEVVQTKTGS